MQLIGLPFAGGNETSYERFRPHLPSNWELIGCALPGKGKRIHEPLLTNIHAMVQQIVQQLEPIVTKPYVLYGHSMGAMLGHLVVHWLRDSGMPLPRHLFVSSFPAPSHHHDRHRGAMNDEQFITHMKRLGGLPPAILNEPKLLRVFLPILRADIAAIDGYRYSIQEPYPVPITAIFGTQETGLASNILDWQHETTAKLKVHRLDGDHFFIYPQAEKLMQLICSTVG